MASVIWIYFTDDVIQNFDDLYLPFNSRFYIIRKTDVNIFEIEDVYQISERSLKIFTIFLFGKMGTLIFSKRILTEGE